MPGWANGARERGPKMSMDCTQLDPPLPRDRRTRSKLTNHKGLLPDTDGRSAQARRFRDIVAQIAMDQGGFSQLSESRVQLVKRFAAACVLAEQMESRLANGEQIDVQEHALLCSTLVRVAQRIGINRIAKNITPSVEEYVRSITSETTREDAA
jgi:hypothetical protein